MLKNSNNTAKQIRPFKNKLWKGTKNDNTDAHVYLLISFSAIAFPTIIPSTTKARKITIKPVSFGTVTPVIQYAAPLVEAFSVVVEPVLVFALLDIQPIASDS